MNFQRQKALDSYYKNPNICLYCGKIIEVPEGIKVKYIRDKKFCNSSCSAKYNNSIRKLNKKVETYVCLNCGKENIAKRNSTKKFCDNKCQNEYYYKQYIIRWKNGEENGLSGKYGLSSHIRRYMLEKAEYKCIKCGWNEINKTTGNTPLNIHHKDGNYMNNNEDNLEVLCPNCHSLTETYGSLNKNGRKERSNKKDN